MSTRLIRDRFDLGLSVREAAERIGVSRETLRLVELGHKPQPANAKLIAEFYGYRPSEIWPIPDKEDAAA